MRFKSKLLLKPDTFKPSFKDWKIEGAFNPAAVRLQDKKIALYVRIAESAGFGQKNMTTCPVMSSESEYKANYQKINEKDIIRRGKWGEMYLKDGSCRLPTISHFRKAILSSDGFSVENIGNKPIFTGIPGESDYGVEDPRIIEMDGKYYMTYVSISNNEGVSTCLAVSKNVDSWTRNGIIFREQNKDAVIFPEKIKGKYVALHRPEGFFKFSRPSIWISYSPDLVYWGRERSILRPRHDSWDSRRIGGGAPPIKTKKGWLIIYHGVREEGEESVYCAGAVLLDLKNPEKIIARSPTNKPLFQPEEDYETRGFINRVVFPTGAVVSLDEKSLLIYYGGADSITAVKQIDFDEIFKQMEYF